MPEVYLVIGLGNPGRQYVKNRHNVGFMLLNEFSTALGTHFSRLQSNALIAQGIYQDKKVVLAKPQTFMNLSGRSIRGLVRLYELPLDRIIIAHDDLDLQIGTLRIRPDGGSGGQKGLASILEYLGTDQFSRIRMGIGRPPGQMQAPDYVLENFNRAEMPQIEDMLSRGVEALKEWISHGLDACMNKYNIKQQEQ
jgi:peptidyl-tRNA hydrolase, PTH1 family